MYKIVFSSEKLSAILSNSILILLNLLKYSFNFYLINVWLCIKNNFNNLCSTYINFQDSIIFNLNWNILINKNCYYIIKIFFRQRFSRI